MLTHNAIHPKHKKANSVFHIEPSVPCKPPGHAWKIRVLPGITFHGKTQTQTFPAPDSEQKYDDAKACHGFPHVSEPEWALATFLLCRAMNNFSKLLASDLPKFGGYALDRLRAGRSPVTSNRCFNGFHSLEHAQL